VTEPGRSGEPPNGFTVALCCHNSARRLPHTLQHLARQRVRATVPWEVLLIDNASSDGTADLARRQWPKGPPAPLHVFTEPTLGLGYARLRALERAAYRFVAFVDDDNWLEPEWVDTAWETMTEHPEVGALGGHSTAAFETPPPRWFSEFKTLYAVGPDDVPAGDITEHPGLLWGAGLTVRLAAWRGLRAKGYTPALVGRHGTALTAGEDTELCLALRLAGWRLWYEPNLRLTHYCPAGRLTWRYARRLYRGSGAATPVHDAYYFALRAATDPLPPSHKTWWWQAGATLWALARRPANVAARLRNREGDPRVTETEALVGRLGSLIRRRGAYDVAVRSTATAPWRAA